MKHIVADTLNLDTKQYDPRSFLASISSWKNELIEPEEALLRANAEANPMEVAAARAYQIYQDELKKNQTMDFDDLIMKTIQLFESSPETLEFYQRKFRYIHVDEYQDTNEAQYRLVNMLAQGFRNLCVVGDADQSIYGWRGANMENILNFEKDYKDATVIKLEQNYRSTKTILQAANEVIEHNLNRKDKTLWTENESGDKITYYRADNAADEGYFVIKNIQKEIREKHRSYNDFAILYRTNAQSRTLEETFVKANIPTSWSVPIVSTIARKSWIFWPTCVWLPIRTIRCRLRASSMSRSAESAQLRSRNCKILPTCMAFHCTKRARALI